MRFRMQYFCRALLAHRIQRFVPDDRRTWRQILEFACVDKPCALLCVADGTLAAYKNSRFTVEDRPGRTEP